MENKNQLIEINDALWWLLKGITPYLDLKQKEMIKDIFIASLSINQNNLSKIVEYCKKNNITIDQYDSLFRLEKETEKHD